MKERKNSSELLTVRVFPNDIKVSSHFKWSFSNFLCRVVSYLEKKIRNLLSTICSAGNIITSIPQFPHYFNWSKGLRKMQKHLSNFKLCPLAAHLLGQLSTKALNSNLESWQHLRRKCLTYSLLIIHRKSLIFH